jgi:hypothetical protein
MNGTPQPRHWVLALRFLSLADCHPTGCMYIHAGFWL